MHRHGWEKEGQYKSELCVIGRSEKKGKWKKMKVLPREINWNRIKIVKLICQMEILFRKGEEEKEELQNRRGKERKYREEIEKNEC